jgi:hypothetical protein
MFRGKIQDCFEMPGKGLVVMLAEIEGQPKLGAVVDFLGGHRRIVDIGQPVSARDSATEQLIAPEGSVVLDWPEGRPAPQAIRGAEIKEVVLL